MARAANTPQPLPFDVRLARFSANALIGVLVMALLVAAMWWLARSPLFTLRGITLEGDQAHNTALSVRRAVNGKHAGSFL
jgi:cell division protein FtsQ